MLARRSRSAFLLLTLSLAFLFSALTSLAERVEDLPKPTDYVSDFAHVLSPETVARLDRLCSQLDHSPQLNTQVAIVILKNLDGDDKADFANRLEDKWKVGKKGTDRGVLMLITVEDRHYFIEVGYGLEGILNDAKVGDIGRAMVPSLKAHDYDSAATIGLTDLANDIAADAKVSLQQDPDAAPRVQQRQPMHRGVSFAGLIFRIILIVLVLVFLGGRGLFGFALGSLFGGGFGGRGGGWGGGGGGWGGGGGGDSGGGGFGGFGGGDSGGGGAGGDY